MRKHCHRKERDPRGCITSRLPLEDNQLRDLGIAYRASLEAMLNGKGDDQAFNTLACALNIALVLCERGIGEEFIPTIKHAQNCLINCRERAARFNNWSFTADEARTILKAFAIHDEQIPLATKKEIVFSLDEVRRRIEQNEVLV
ncbi:MAG: hypothetical protein WC236_14890 [Gallionellaceae bacterium]